MLSQRCRLSAGWGRPAALSPVSASGSCATAVGSGKSRLGQGEGGIVHGWGRSAARSTWSGHQQPPSWRGRTFGGLLLQVGEDSVYERDLPASEGKGSQRRVCTHTLSPQSQVIMSANLEVRSSRMFSS